MRLQQLKLLALEIILNKFYRLSFQRDCNNKCTLCVFFESQYSYSKEQHFNANNKVTW
jgi:hypothetical protein